MAVEPRDWRQRRAEKHTTERVTREALPADVALRIDQLEEGTKLMRMQLDQLIAAYKQAAEDQRRLLDITQALDERISNLRVREAA